MSSDCLLKGGWEQVEHDNGICCGAGICTCNIGTGTTPRGGALTLRLGLDAAASKVLVFGSTKLVVGHVTKRLSIDDLLRNYVASLADLQDRRWYLREPSVHHRS